MYKFLHFSSDAVRNEPKTCVSFLLRDTKILKTKVKKVKLNSVLKLAITKNNHSDKLLIKKRAFCPRFVQFGRLSCNHWLVCKDC